MGHKPVSDTTSGVMVTLNVITTTETHVELRTKVQTGGGRMYGCPRGPSSHLTLRSSQEGPKEQGTKSDNFKTGETVKRTTMTTVPRHS